MDTLPARFWAKVEKTDTCWIWIGNRTRKGYGQIWLDGKTRSVHRLAVEEASGEPIPLGMQVDHICYNRACVRPDHLQVVTGQKNRENLPGPYACNGSGVRGVTWASDRGKWSARVRVRGKMHFGGYFDDLRVAEAAAVALRNKLMTNNLADRGGASGLAETDGRGASSLSA